MNVIGDLLGASIIAKTVACIVPGPIGSPTLFKTVSNTARSDPATPAVSIVPIVTINMTINYWIRAKCIPAA